MSSKIGEVLDCLKTSAAALKERGCVVRPYWLINVV